MIPSIFVENAFWDISFLVEHIQALSNRTLYVHIHLQIFSFPILHCCVKEFIQSINHMSPQPKSSPGLSKLPPPTSLLFAISLLFMTPSYCFAALLIARVLPSDPMPFPSKIAF